MTVVIVDILEVLVVPHHIYGSHYLMEDRCHLTLNMIAGDLLRLTWMALLVSLSLSQVLELLHQDLTISAHSDHDRLVDMIVGK